MRGGGCDGRDAEPSGAAGPGRHADQAGRRLRLAGWPRAGSLGKGAAQPDGRGVGGPGRGRLRVPPPVDLHPAEWSARPGVLPRRARASADGGGAAARGGLRGAAGGAAGHGPHHPAADVGPPPRRPRRTGTAPGRRRAGRAVLDGGWWPRSWDPVAELPGLILALDGRFGPIRQVLLNSGAWDHRFRRLAVGARVVRMGWFTSLDPALLIATTQRGDQLDLLVIPPGTAEAAARAAMARAADPADTTRAPGILTAIPAVPDDAPDDDVAPTLVWDNEGGHLAEARIPRPAGALSTARSR